MALDPKLTELLNAITGPTSSGALEWTETADEGSFRAIFPQSMVRIGLGYGPLGYRQFFTIILIDKKGRIVEEWKVDTDQVQNADFALVDTLYQRARAQARGSSILINQIISDMETVKS